MAKQIYIKKSDREKIYKFLRLLKKKGVEASEVILFGSYAKGNANPDSDLDIAVVSSQLGEDAATEMMFLRKLALTVDSHIEPIPLSPQGLEDPYSTLVQEIKRYGIPLLNR